MTLIEIPVSILVPRNRTVAVSIGPVRRANVGVKFIPSLSAGADLDYYLFDAESFGKLPNAKPFRQWSGEALTESMTLPGPGPWYLLVANRQPEPVQMLGSIGYGAV